MTEGADKQRIIGKPFEKGHSGNIKGRPKKEVCVTSWLKEYAGQLLSKPIDASKLTYAQAAALSAWKAAAKGELDNYNFIIERIEGKTTTTIDMTSKGNELKGTTVFQIINEETKNLVARIERGERTDLAIDNNLPAERGSLPEPTETPLPK